ncbi:Transketolase 1 [Hartmannibacter diazotrophicus]|uniref:Transketolase n=1 Tax=Hartmannibacter diazotrophicus TaxID=1482074 RepID=A0A2C9DA29_9HYPH|nr:transketolase [Hartmannibacter diazotrophicus]SON57184.1 Transketolase 1 [Hartmannibacter diazotrophicus]
MIDIAEHTAMANAIRALAMDAVERAKSGHPGMPMGTADIATVLFTQFMKFDPSATNWPDRDRFVLSAGHGSMLLYSLLHLLGVEDMTIEDLKNFRQLGSKTAGHPEYGHAAGIETTTGPLGQGLATAVGMALAERIMNAEFGDDIVDHMTYVIAGDGCLMEGVSHEAIDLAGHLKLNKLVVLFDDNGITIDGSTSMSTSIDQLERFEAHGWRAERIDGLDPQAIEAALERAKASSKPSLIACRTVIGYGAPHKAGSHAAHGAPLGADEIAGAREKLGWPYPPFEIPAEIRDAWRVAGLKSGQARKEWEKRFKALDPETRATFERRIRGDLPAGVADKIEAYKAALVAEKPKVASRKASENALQMLAEAVPELLGGSADLTASNLTKAKVQKPVTPDDFDGRYIYYGIREFGMSAAMNGIALHGGFIPYGGTFLVFTDYARPAMRLAALMGVRVIYVMTHDSIGLGEDGPTHQPVEHLASLRAIPNMLVLRPGDAVETLEAWDVALNHRTGPSLLALSRQNLAAFRLEMEKANKVSLGAYEVAGCEGEADVSIFATGSEVNIALEAKALIEEAGKAARVVSVPSFELFAKQSADYRAEVIGNAKVKVGVEAAIRMGWDGIIGLDGIFVGMSTFGASGKAEDLYEHFGITPKAIAEKALEKLED